MMNVITRVTKAKQIKMTGEAILDSLSTDWAQIVLGELGDLNSLTAKQLKGIEYLADLANDEEEQRD